MQRLQAWGSLVPLPARRILATADLVVVSPIPICEVGSILIGTRPERKLRRMPDEDVQARTDLAF